MDFLKFKNAEDFLTKTGLSIKQGLSIVEEELQNLKEKS
jgi:hypothetical protein